MTAFVLVHPAWFGGWCWKRVVPPLRSAGHEVHAPTLTGLGDRVHLANAGISLSTHVEDVVNVVLTEDLNHVTLVGSSSGGTVISGVADRVPERIERLVYLDAFVPSDGQSTSDLVPPDRWAALENLIRTEGDGWMVPRFSPSPWERIVREIWQVSDEDLDWIVSRLHPTPVGHFTEPLRIRKAVDGAHTPRRVYIRCTGNPGPPFDVWAVAAQSNPDWTYGELPTPHLPFITHAEETAKALLALAG